MEKHKIPGKQLRFDELFRLLNFCKTIQTEGTDPFDLDVKQFLETLKRYTKKWHSLDDLLLDAEAIAELAKIIELQGQWIKDRATSFYIDPELLELKLRLLEPQQLVTAFFNAWQPIIAQDRMTPERLREGLAYWNSLVPLNERGEEFPLPTELEPAFNLEDLITLNVLSPSEFDDALQAVLSELEECGRIEYRDFIYTNSFEESVARAYLTSYLVNEGNAELDINPLEDIVCISPREAHRDVQAARTAPSRSIPVSISYEDWLGWRGKRKQR
jgi:hypothetical protein